MTTVIPRRTIVLRFSTAVNNIQKIDACTNQCENFDYIDGESAAPFQRKTPYKKLVQMRYELLQ